MSSLETPEVCKRQNGLRKPLTTVRRWPYNCFIGKIMLRPIAFSLLFVGFLSYPVALLCMDECTMQMGTGNSSTTSAFSTIQGDMRECCLGSALVSKQWEAKPLAKLIQLDAPLLPAPGLLAIGLSRAPSAATPLGERGSPPTLSSFQILRI